MRSEKDKMLAGELYDASAPEIQAELASHVRISVAHVSSLYQQVYLPLLACHERPAPVRSVDVTQREGIPARLPYEYPPHSSFDRRARSVRSLAYFSSA